MRILKVIHGYPPRYNAGSEVYSQTLCHKLASNHEVEVFTRFEDPFSPDYTMQYEVDQLEPRVKLNMINIPLEKHRYQYRIPEVDQQFANLLQKFQPDLIHIGHLNHLSASLITKVPQEIPIIYTLHDYWLMCPRGQFLQRVPENLKEVWGVCDRQDHTTCALRCYGGYFSGAQEDYGYDKSYWEGWLARRMNYFKTTVTNRIDYFIAPAQFLLEKFKKDFAIPSNKLSYLDYGFDLERLKNRKRDPNEPFTFGYIGTHIPAKGIQLLIAAFGKLSGASKLRIWGRARGENTAALKALTNSLPQEVRQRIEWLPEYHNHHLVSEVFNKVDAIVVPSIWYENSPLVIHEALQVRIPVITADIGGMAEYVHHNINGLLFKHRDVASLAGAMQQLANAPNLAASLGSRGYLQTPDGKIPSIAHHVAALENIYQQAFQTKKMPR